MVKVIGTDSGTWSYDIYGFNDETNEVLIDKSIPRSEITANPRIVVDYIKEIDRVHDIDVIVASSGYGMPLKLAKNVSDEEIALATFITEKDVRKRLRIIGLRKLLKILKEDSDLNYRTYFTPGVIHLPTVPRYRKINRIDMGTSDKVYTAALAIARYSEANEINYDKVNLIVVEIGFAYTSALAVKNGQIVDAMAGTAGFPGFLGMGFMDGEIVYALANVTELSKDILFKGGAAYVSGLDPFKFSYEEFVKHESDGYKLMIEAVVKDVLVLLCSTTPSVIYLSGRFSRIPAFVENIEKKFAEIFNALGIEKIKIVKLNSHAKIAKEAAEGASLIASGLANGKYRKLVDVLKLKESSGTIFDYITIIDPNELKTKYSLYLD